MNQKICGKFAMGRQYCNDGLNHFGGREARPRRVFIHGLKIYLSPARLTSGDGGLGGHWPSVTLAGGGGSRWTCETPIWSKAAGAASQGTAPWLRTLSKALAGS